MRIDLPSAIETDYNGYKYRSRLEARWAVAFDKMGIKYEYEPEGFENNGVAYLPDFYLPESNLYAEVKPYRVGAKEDIKRMSRLIANTGLRVILLPTIPDSNCGVWAYSMLYYNALFGQVFATRIPFYDKWIDAWSCKSGSPYDIEKMDDQYSARFIQDLLTAEKCDVCGADRVSEQCEQEHWNPKCEGCLAWHDAYTQARAARFEKEE